MKSAIGLILLLSICLCTPAWAEFYKYTDENGTVRFTDDLSKVPVGQRPGVTSYEGAQPKVSPSEASTGMQENSPPVVEKDSNAKGVDTSQGEEIKKKQTELSTEHQSLMDEKAHLDAEWEKAKTTLEKHQVNLKKEDLNRKIIQYEEKRKSLNSEIEAYNASIPKDAPENKKK